MIDESLQEAAVEYLLETLDPQATRAFEARMMANAELAALVDELRESLGALALSAPLHRPPPRLRERVLAVAHGEAGPQNARAGKTNWLPWAIAASLAAASALLLVTQERNRAASQAEIERWHGADSARTAELAELRELLSTRETELQTLREQSDAMDQNLTARIAALSAESDGLKQQIASLQAEMLEARSRDTLAQIKIATLSAKIVAFARAGAVIVWDPEKQRGVIQLTQLPPPGPGKAYQLWVFDPKYPQPVSGGVVSVDALGSTRALFKPEQEIRAANKFAISVEQAGGSLQPAGPIVFIGE